MFRGCENLWTLLRVQSVCFVDAGIRAFIFYPSKYVRGSFYIIKGIKSSCEWRREKMLLFICIFEGTLFTHYIFLIYIEVVVSEGERKI
ncbi:hypothetical protein Hanom_Chr09g00808201 [Helianthus anomalus]